MPELTPSGDEPLSLTEAANAYANVPTEEAPQGQAEPDEIEEGDPADVEDTDLSLDSEETDDEGEADEQGQAEDEDGEEPETEKGRYVAHNGRVKLPDGTESTVAELIDGRLLRADHTRKTMEVAELRKATETRSSAIAQRETELDKRDEFVTSLIKSIIPAAPDPNLAIPGSPNYNPQLYQQQFAVHTHWMSRLQEMEANQQQTLRSRQEEQAKTTAEKARGEWGKLVERIPDLRDEKKADQFAKDLVRIGQSYGFSEQELMASLPSDHRFSLALRDASKWQRFQANKAKAKQKTENKPAVLKGGVRLDPQRAKAREGRAAMERLNQSGSVKDAVSALLALEGKG